MIWVPEDGLASLIAVCSNRPRPNLQNSHSKGHQWWKRDVWHVAMKGNKVTHCGVRFEDWLTIGPLTEEMLTDPHCCKRCLK